MIEHPAPLSVEELAQRRRQDAFYMATSNQGVNGSRSIEQCIEDAKLIEAYLKGEANPE